jgi:hypothetical protein
MVSGEETTDVYPFTIYHLPFTGNGISRAPEMKMRGTPKPRGGVRRPSR